MIKRYYYDSETRSFSRYNLEDTRELLGKLSKTALDLYKLSISPKISVDRFDYDPGDWGPEYHCMLKSIDPKIILDWISSNYTRVPRGLEYSIIGSKFYFIMCHPQDEYALWYDFSTNDFYATDNWYKPTIKLNDPVKSLIGYYTSQLNQYRGEDEMGSVTNWLHTLISELRKLL